VTTRRGNRRPKAAARDDAHDQGLEVLQKTIALLVGNGYSPSALRTMAAEICSRMPEPKTPNDPRRAAFTAELGHVLTHWYTDPANLDARGEPRALPATGPGASVAKLVRRASPTLDLDVAIGQLLKSGSLRSKGKLYVPTGRRVLFNPKDAVATARGLLPLLGFLDTFDFNLNRRGKAAPRFEMTALNPSFPVAALEAFKARLMKHGMKFLQDIDNYMRRTEDHGKATDPRATVGVGLFLFEDHQKGPRGRASRRRKRS
jgi:hypothetical protein